MSDVNFTARRKKRPHGSPPVIEYDEVPCPVPALTGPCHIYRWGKCQDYGMVKAGGKSVLVHRYVWEQKHGPIEDGKVIDHRCKVHSCCNTDHLRLVTRRVNAIENSVGQAALNAVKTHCPAGHLYDRENTYRYSNGGRGCRKCVRDGNRRRYHEKKPGAPYRRSIRRQPGRALLLVVNVSHGFAVVGKPFVESARTVEFPTDQSAELDGTRQFSAIGKSINVSR